MSISQPDFDYVSDLAKQRSAIVIGEDKKYLVETRLEPLARSQGFGTLEEFISALKMEKAFGSLHAKAIDALTTNETFFFRDSYPFESLKNAIVPELLKRKGREKRLSFWSIACSTGQEPYSIAMLLSEHFPELSDWDVSILATDISSTVLDKARTGRYSQIEVNRGLDADLLTRFFDRDGDHYWVIDSKIRDQVVFRELNLIDSWPGLPPFDVIFLRNVLIYFDVATKQSILEKLKRYMLPEGSLFLGASESALSIDDSWEPISESDSVFYRMRASNGAPPFSTITRKDPLDSFSSS